MAIAINLEYKPYVALYRRLSDGLRKAILEGRLQLGEPMPSVRELSESLKLSRATVLKAYEDLRTQGLVVSLSGSGTFVATTLPGDLGDLLQERFREPETRVLSAPDLHLSERGRQLYDVGYGQLQRHVHVSELNYGGTPHELSPAKEWKALMLKHCAIDEEDKVAEMVAPMGLMSLRQALAQYVMRRRSISLPDGAESICVVGSKQLRLELVGRLLLNSGDVVAYEEPGYPENRNTLMAQGAVIAPIPVDEEGLSVKALRQLPTPPKLIYVTPSHQDPLAMVMSMPRRQELLEYSAAVGAFILEDDFDSEFRYGKPVLPALKALDHHDCVIYMSSFWKVLYQSLRLTYLIFPRCLTKPGHLAKAYLERHLPLIDQLALADLINDGHLEKHLKRCQRLLAHRRQALILAITRYLRDYIEPFGEGGGTHLILNFKGGLSEGDIEAAAARAGFVIYNTNSYYLGQAPDAQFIAPFGGIDPDTIDGIVRSFAVGLATGVH